MKLEIKHLAPYLPYELSGICTEEFTGVELVLGISQYKNSKQYYLITSFDDLDIEMFKPILRPIQEVEQYFESLYGCLEHQDVTDYFDADFLASNNNIEISEIQLLESEQIPYGTLKVLLKHHFDVFGLIEKGLAVDINTLSVQNDG